MSMCRCCAVLCCAVLCCAVPCCAVLCCAVLCCAVLCKKLLINAEVDVPEGAVKNGMHRPSNVIRLGGAKNTATALVNDTEL